MSYMTPSPLNVAALRATHNNASGIDHAGDSYAILVLGHRDSFRFFDCIAKHYYPENGSISPNSLSIEESSRRNINLFTLEDLLKGYYSTASLSEEAWAMKRHGGTSLLYIPCENNHRLAIAWSSAKRDEEFALDMCKLLGKTISEYNKSDETLRAQVEKIIISGVNTHTIGENCC